MGQRCGNRAGTRPPPCVQGFVGFEVLDLLNEPVGEGARSTRASQPAGVPHGVLDPASCHHALLLVARERGGRVRLRQEVLLVEILAELPGSNLPK